jgi:hypothetical protein
MNQERQCCELLANYLCSLTKLSARWVSFTRPSHRIESTNSDCVDCLSDLMGLEYNSMYLPFMQQCQLFHVKKSNRWGHCHFAPCISGDRRASYTWEDFLLEYQLQPSICQISHYYRNGKKEFFLLVGTFDGAPFSVREQIVNPRILGAASRGLRAIQQSFAKSLAFILPSLTPLPSLPINQSTENYPSEESELVASESVPLEDASTANLKQLLQVQLFDQILKPDADATIIWNLIDSSKLRVRLERTLQAVREQAERRVQENLEKIGTDASVPIELTGGKTIDNFPALRLYGIPMVATAIHSVLRDIVSLSKHSVNVDILTIPLFNRADAFCNLVPVPTSSNYDWFKKNLNRTKWVRKLLLAASNNDNEEVAARWLMQHLGYCYNDCFVEVACKLGLLLPPKEMDAETAAAMWEEANVPVRAQRIILRHIKKAFGRRITVPERKLKELEDGALPPISGSVNIGNDTIDFWYKRINDVICHRIQTELTHGQDFIKQFDSLDVVLGCDHGARRFRAELRLIFRNQNNAHSVSLCVGSINCAKDTRAILEATIGKHLDDGLHFLVRNNYAVAHMHNMQHIVSLAEEPPAAAPDGGTHWFKLRPFIAGDLAFFATVLGKENMSTTWCTWCKLSKSQWSPEGHLKGELWTLQHINDIRDNIEVNNAVENPATIMGCTARPLFQHIPIYNYIISILHIIIGVGNKFVDQLYEWVEERVEQLTAEEREHRNTLVYAQARHEIAEDNLQEWLQNEGVNLVQKQLESQAISSFLSEKVKHY